MLVATLTELKAKTVGKTLGEVEAEARFLTRYHRWWLRQMRKHLSVWRPRHRAKQKLTLLQDWRKHSCRHTD